MSIKPLPALALLAGLGVAACDNAEQENQITALEGQLQTAQGEVAELEGQIASAQEGLQELETLRAELEEARARVEELEARPTREELEAELQAGGEGELEALRTELESARARIEELETAQAETSAAAPTAAGVASSGVVGEEAALEGAALREPLAAAISALRTVDQQLAQLRDTLVGEGYEDIEIEQPRSYLEAAGQSIARAAEAAGIDPETLQP